MHSSADAKVFPAKLDKPRKFSIAIFSLFQYTCMEVWRTLYTFFYTLTYTVRAEKFLRTWYCSVVFLPNHIAYGERIEVDGSSC